MRYLKALSASLLLLSSTVSAQWQKINDVDYVWGPFSIYNLTLFSESGDYTEGTRPLMLTLKYHKPVDGRDFAISLARSWSNLGITLPEQESVVDRLRKIMPNIKKGDSLSYIALADHGYFVLNDLVIDEEFNQDFNNAVVAVWLDPRVEIGRALLSKKPQVVETAKPSVANSNTVVDEKKVAEPQKSEEAANPQAENPAEPSSAEASAVAPEKVDSSAQVNEPAESKGESVEPKAVTQTVETEPDKIAEASEQKVDDSQPSAKTEEPVKNDAKVEEAKPQAEPPKEREQPEKNEDQPVEISPPGDPLPNLPLG